MSRSNPLPPRSVDAAELRRLADVALDWKTEFYHDEVHAILMGAALALEGRCTDAPYAFWLGADV